MNQRLILAAGALVALVAVALGAFGAHALKTLLAENARVETYELAVRYQFYHAFALMIIGIVDGKFAKRGLLWAAVLIFAGVILFSGSLYLFALTNMTSFAIATPFGGLLLLLGWAVLFFQLIKKQS